jgi:hypothetical protein
MNREGAPSNSALDRPLQGAEVREEVTSGPPALPGRESARGPQHGGEARNAAKTPKVLPCKARVIRRRPDCLNPRFPAVQTFTLPDTASEIGATGIG